MEYVVWALIYDVGDYDQKHMNLGFLFIVEDLN